MLRMTGATGQPRPEDPYQVLGLAADASQAEVTRAFRRLARTEHPDVHGGAPEADEEYRRIRRAYEQLSDPGRRGGYDTGPSAPRASRGRRIPVRVRSHTPRRGDDITVRARVSLADAVYGTSRRLSTVGPRRDGSAAGTGAGGPDEGIEDGTGAGDGGRRLASVRIPPGTRPGARLRIPGHGAAGRHGGPPGDLLVAVDVAPDPRFSQHGSDLHTTATVSYPELVLGADVPIEALDGRTVSLHVPAGTVPGARLRVAGHGVPAAGRSAAGDMIVEVRLHLPTELSAQARDALAALAAALPPPRSQVQRATWANRRDQAE